MGGDGREGVVCTLASGFLRRRVGGGESVCTCASLRDLITRVAIFFLSFFLVSGGGEDGGTLASEGEKWSFTLALFDAEPVRRGVEVALGELMTSVAVAVAGGGDGALGHVLDLVTADIELDLEGSDHPTRSRALGFRLGLALAIVTLCMSSTLSSSSVLFISGVFGAVAYSDRTEPRSSPPCRPSRWPDSRLCPLGPMRLSQSSGK